MRWMSLRRRRRTRAFCARVRRPALAVVGLCHMQNHYTGERPFYFCARPWRDVPVETSNAQPAFAWHARAPDISREEAQHGSLLRPRAVPRLLQLVRAICREIAPARGLSLFSARPWCDVPALPFNTLQTFAWHTRARHCVGCLSGVGAARDLAGRARRAALAVVGLSAMQEHCTGERPLPFDARPLCDEPAAASNAHSAFAWHARARKFASYLSGGSAARELAARARRAALILVGSCHTQRHCPGESSLSFGGRPWYDVPAAAFNTQPAFAWHTGAPLRWLPLRRRRSTGKIPK